MINPKTQKAKGIMNGLTSLGCLYQDKRSSQFMRIRRHRLIRNKEDIKKLEIEKLLPRFARPCPLVPRHGFVDSRTIFDIKKLYDLLDEVKKQDPDGEIIIGPHLPNAKYNAVYVNSGTLSVGPGNDGATAGKKSISFPVGTHIFGDQILKDSGLSTSDAVYVEAVYSDYRWILTQLRGGPKFDNKSEDFIPKKFKIEKVVKPHDNLLKWENDVKSFDPGTVVYGNGYTLASHAAIHCILHNIPFITSHKPITGEILQPKNNKNIPLNRARFKRGVCSAFKTCASEGTDGMLKMFLFSISVLHNWSYLRQSKEADWLLGAAITIFAKVGSSLILGEQRHKFVEHGSRSEIYSSVLQDKEESFYKMFGVFKDFCDGTWRSGYGGLPWATCAWYIDRLCKYILDSYGKKGEKLSDKEISNLIALMNRITNISHNNGWWFNKIADKMDMDQFALEPGWSAFMVSDMYMEIYNNFCKIKNIKKVLPKLSKRNRPPFFETDKGLSWVFLRNVISPTSCLIGFVAEWKDSPKHIEFEISRNEADAIKKIKIKNKLLRKIILKVNKDGTFNMPGSNRRVHIDKIQGL